MHSFSLFAYSLLFPFFHGTAKLIRPFFPKLQTFFKVRKGGIDELGKKSAEGNRLLLLDVGSWQLAVGS